MKFIILLHKVAYDYVTLFDVYECTISPDVLERKIHDAELRLEERYFVLVPPEDFRAHIADLKSFLFMYDEALAMFNAKEMPGLRAFVKGNSIECGLSVRAPSGSLRFFSSQIRWTRRPLDFAPGSLQ